MNPVILWEPGTRRNPSPAQRAAAPSECPVVQGKELLNGLESKNSYFMKFNIRLVWYLYELNGIWPFYYLLLGSVFPCLDSVRECWCKALTCSALLGASQE